MCLILIELLRSQTGTASRRYKGANKPRGVSNRNAGLKWVKVHAKDGVIYFADDDNTYDYRIFDEVRLFYQTSSVNRRVHTGLINSPVSYHSCILPRDTIRCMKVLSPLFAYLHVIHFLLADIYQCSHCP